MTAIRSIRTPAGCIPTATILTAIDCGENFIVHREGPEATPYLPNVIVSSNPLVRPNDYGIPLNAEHWDERTIRNVKMPWAEAKKTKNFLWEKGYQFYCLTPKSRHSVHSSLGERRLASDLELELWRSVPHRQTRCPTSANIRLHMNPQAARDLGINDGDYVYVDANPADRPYLGATPDDPFYKVTRLHAALSRTTRLSVQHRDDEAWLVHRDGEKREGAPDPARRAVALGETVTNPIFRFGSQQSVTRNWHMPMHQTDTLFHKAKAFMSFLFGGEADNHAVNTVPKEYLVRVTKAEDGGMGGKGLWKPATTGIHAG